MNFLWDEQNCAQIIDKNECKKRGNPKILEIDDHYENTTNHKVRMAELSVGMNNQFFVG